MFSTLEVLVHHAEDVNRLAQIGRLNSLSDEVGPGQVQTHRERVDILRQLKDALGRMWWTDSSPILRAAEVLANTSRSRESTTRARSHTSRNSRSTLMMSAAEWRLPLGESGLLDFFLEVISDVQVPNQLLLPSLRLIGNACAETGKGAKPPPAPKCLIDRLTPA